MFKVWNFNYNVLNHSPSTIDHSPLTSIQMNCFLIVDRFKSIFAEIDLFCGVK
jgi:hypothetical protein